MTGFYLLCAHLLGDYVFQNDWMAAWKSAPSGKTTLEEDAWVLSHHGDPRMYALSGLESWSKWRPSLACFTHCLVYTLCVALCSWWWMPLWGYVACFSAHYAIDRPRFAAWWMNNIACQKEFAKNLAPWSIIVVDNSMHLLTLALIAALVGVH